MSFSDPNPSQSKVAHITTVHAPFDPRIFHKECVSLANAGFQVTLICCHPQDEVVEGVQIRALPKPAGRLSRMTKTMLQAFRKALSERADLYHFHDPELLPLGFALRLLGKRVVYDVHEDQRLKMREKTYLPYPLRNFFAWLVGTLESLCGLIFNGIVVVTPHIARHFPAKKTALIRNYPRAGEFDLTSQIPYSDRPPHIAYVGGIAPIRGIHRMIEAVQQLPAKLNANLILAGPVVPKSLEEKLQSGTEWNFVQFKGYLNRLGIQDILAHARLGILVYDPTPCYKEGYPLKLFEFMAAGIPVVSANFPVWRDIVQQANCGIAVDPMSVNEISEAITYLLENPIEAEAMGVRGQEAARTIYFWENEARDLIAFYRRLLNCNSPRPSHSPEKSSCSP